MKQLVKIFLLILITNYFGACSETGKEVHNSASESNIESTPTPTPIETIYDEVYSNQYGGGYSTYLFFDYDSNAGMEVTYYHTHRGKKPSTWGSYDYFTFTGNFDDGLYIQECGSDKQQLWIWNSKKDGYIVPKYEWGISHVDTHHRTNLEQAIIGARNHGVKDRLGCE